MNTFALLPDAEQSFLENPWARADAGLEFQTFLSKLDLAARLHHNAIKNLGESVTKALSADDRFLGGERQSLEGLALNVLAMLGKMEARPPSRKHSTWSRTLNSSTRRSASG
jgi:hypothetical protein